MKKNILISLFFILSILSQGQSLNGFKYVFVPSLQYQNGRVDIWDISSSLRDAFQKKGFHVLSENSEIPNEVLANPCLVVNCIVDHTNVYYGKNSINLKLIDCNQKVIYTNQEKAFAEIQSNSYKKAVRKLANDISYMNYTFSQLKTPELDLPKVEQTDETENSLKEYYRSNTIDELEGIYKSYQSDQMGYYMLGIKKYGNEYKAIVIESGYSHWTTGEVKAVFTPSSMKGFYSTRWYMGNKTPVETFASMDNPALLSVEFKDVETDGKRTDKFIKMFPPAEMNSNTNEIGVKATGSGFIISTDGIIATNAHVISDAQKIEITLINEFGATTYTAIKLLEDKSNDVALLKIDDEKFKGFNNLPYSIIQETDIGEDVFTIGYPLNSLMGDNYKVTNGIISSNTGIKDDPRHIQTTTPIQPGNSGGPLFNKDGNIIGITSSKLNSQSTENVNYAVKTTYLVNIYNMLPNKETLGTNSNLKDTELKEQVKILKNYVCLIKIY